MERKISKFVAVNCVLFSPKAAGIKDARLEEIMDRFQDKYQEQPHVGVRVEQANRIVFN